MEISCRYCRALIKTVSLICTEFFNEPYQDEDGQTHDHDQNSHVAEIECPAKCGFGSKVGTFLHEWDGPRQKRFW